MSNNMHAVRLRLGAFAVVLAGTFGTAYAAGEALPGHDHGSDAGNDGGSHDHGASTIDDGAGPDHAATADGDAIPTPTGTTDDGYQLVVEARPADGRQVAMHVVDPAGGRVTELVDHHGASLHAVLVRPDLSGFQHLHPDIADDGSFVIDIDQSGLWRVILDLLPAGASRSIVLSTNVDDEVATDPVPLPEPDDSIVVEDLVVSRTGLAFVVGTTDGTAPALEPYLGQAAHLIAIRAGDLAYAHLHPLPSTAGTGFVFDGALPDPGTYRLFLQFGHTGTVLTVPFTVVVA